MEDDVLKLPSFTPTQQAVTELQRYERDDIIVTDASGKAIGINRLAYPLLASHSQSLIVKDETYRYGTVPKSVRINRLREYKYRCLPHV